MNSSSEFAPKTGQMQPDEIRMALKAALKDRAPAAHAEMQSRGQLATFLDSLTQMVVETQQGTEAAIPAAVREIGDPVKIVQRVNAMRAEATEAGMAQAIEEIDALNGPQPEEAPDGEQSLYELTGR